MAFVNAYRVPFQYRNYVASRLRVGCLVAEARGPSVRDLDGNWAYDLGGSYGVNLFGHEFYKGSIERGMQRARGLGMTLGSYHPLIQDNVRRLKAVSGMDDVSFHMSGTEAVMQAVRLARYHTRRSHLVRFCGAYHGWWDGVQAGVGNPRPPREIYTLKEMDRDTLRVLRTRDDIACVLVNPDPGDAPQRGAAGRLDARRERPHGAATIGLPTGDGSESSAKSAPRAGSCSSSTTSSSGSALALGGHAGVLRCARGHGHVRQDARRRPARRRGVRAARPHAALSRRPAGRHLLCARDVQLAPVVMATMNEFLRHLDDPAVRAGYRDLDARWNERASEAQRARSRAAGSRCAWRT